MSRLRVLATVHRTLCMARYVWHCCGHAHGAVGEIPLTNERQTRYLQSRGGLATTPRYLAGRVALRAAHERRSLQQMARKANDND